MRLTSQAIKAVPEIMRWFQWKADDVHGKAAQTWLRVAANYLGKEAARLVPDDTMNLLSNVELWPWAHVGFPTFEYDDDGEVTSWTRSLIRNTGDQPCDVSHEAIISTMARIVETHATPREGTPAPSDLPQVDDTGIDLITAVLEANDRPALNEALAALPSEVCVAIIDEAAFGGTRHGKG